eukprot:gb/GEZN01001016.1/.p1 GENE.gb/GEZN01001016.1/~~gb/GEZN01001016.1/.p1  ORF type:complete len:1072 (+),score=15.70 gb/GEZN01001016.1/:33-3218(+)
MCIPGEYRTGCGGSDPGTCQRCTNAPPNSIHIKADSCGWACVSDYYQVGNFCEACPADCAVGKYRLDCGKEFKGTCVSCTGQPSGSVFTTGGGLNNTCSWMCPNLFWLSSLGTDCLPCERCKVGQFRQGCSQSSGSGTCQLCSGLDLHARFITDGGFKDDCGWECEAGFILGGNGVCFSCNYEACAVGQYLRGCGGNKTGSCMACTQKPPRSHFVSNGGLGDSCDFQCNKGFYFSEAEGLCLQCLTDCSVGEYRSECGGNVAGSCSGCTGLPEKAFWVGDGGLTDSCLWSCLHGWYRDDDASRCVACVECVAGQYRTGCGGSDPGTCQQCSNAPSNSIHIKSDSCGWTCASAYHKVGNFCEACSVDCGVGKYRFDCGQAFQGTCVSCTGQPMGSVFTTGGGLSNSCSWVCPELFWLSDRGTDCLPCLRCNVGEFRKSCSQALGSGACQTCSGLKSNALFTTDGGFNDVCAWECKAGFYLGGNGSCMSCNYASCAVGQYLKGCGSKIAGSCVVCTQKPASSHFVASGGMRDNCAFECNAGFYLNFADGVCLQCQTDCQVGFYRARCNGGMEGSCVTCSGLPVDAYWTGDGGLENRCSWSCLAGFFKQGNQCVACAACSLGKWRTRCGDDSPGQCVACTNAIGHSHYTSGGNTQPNSCNWECDSFFFLSAAGGCEVCRRDCPAGTYMLGCTPRSQGQCVACTNLPPNAYYLPDVTGSSIDTGNCPFQCKPSYFGTLCNFCDPAVHCGRAGSCFVSTAGPVFCECQTYFSGANCETCNVNAACGGRADSCAMGSSGLVCLKQGQQGCYPGWTGGRCQYCDAGVLCNGHGQCRNNNGGACDCNNGFKGQGCDSCSNNYYPASGPYMCSRFCTSEATCSSHAQCTSQGICGDCIQGWTGSNCGTPRAVVLPDVTLCPSYAPLLLEVFHPEVTCKGDCSSCNITASWLSPDSATPSCQYSDNKYYKMFQGTRCWDGPSTCYAYTGKGVVCKAYEPVYSRSNCPGNRQPLTRYWAAKTCQGDCSSCVTEEGFAVEPPTCSFRSNANWLGSCNGATCVADRVTAVACPP